MDGPDDPPIPAALAAGQWSDPEPFDLGGGVFTAAVLLSVPADAVEWTAEPEVGVAEGWRPCRALGAGRWRLDGADGGHRRGPGGRIRGLGLRWRPAGGGAWSPACEDRRDLDVPAAARAFPPVLLLAPALAGSGRIGSEVRVRPGGWAGLPAPELARQWCRDGTPIPGATAATYVPGAADDRSALSCRVTARSRVGTAVAATAALAVRYPPPGRAAPPFDEILEEIFDQDSGPQEVPVAAYFTGPARGYAVAGAGAEVDAAGVVTIPTDVALAEEVTVTASNSGGAAEARFMVTVEPAERLLLVADGKGKPPRKSEAAPPAAAAPAGAGGWRVLPALGRAEVEAFLKRGELSGDAGQYMLGAAQSEAEPDRIYTCQDSGGVWVSLDHGASWNNLRNRGLHARFTTGIAVDPLDCRRVFVLTQGGGMGAEKFIGLQRSLDGGLSWERVIANDVSPGRSTQSPIGFAPTSSDPGLGYATRWYCVIQKDSYRKRNGHPHGFWLSDDGGASWRKVRDLDAQGYGALGHLVVDPTDAAVVYLSGETGLWRFEAADRPDGAVTRLSGAGGLPKGGIRERIHLSPDGRLLIAGVAKAGVWRSEDGGGRWREVAADPELGKLHVNPWDPQRMIVSYGEKGRQLRVSTDGGGSFRQPERVDAGPGGGDKATIGEGTCLVVWHPEKPERIWAHGGPKHWQSDDAGRTWRPANGYFNGKQHQNWFIDQMFDPKDAGRFGYFMTDFGVGLTTNGGLWFDRGRMVTRKLDLLHATVNGGALHPDPGRRTILASVGKMNAGKLVLSQDDGATWRVASDGEERRQYVGFDLDDPRYAFQWRERSQDHGASWAAMPGLPKGFAVSGMTLTAPDMGQGQAVFAIDRDRNGGNSRILRSLDRGESWERFVDSPYDFGIEGMTGGGPCRAHPSDPAVFFTKGPNDWTIRRWTPGKKPGYLDLNVMAGFPRGVPPDGMFAAMALAIDRRRPEVMYVANAWDNVPCKLFRTVDGGASWENITEGFPGVFLRGLEVSPVTGDLFIGTPNGSRVLPPPYAEPEAVRSLAAADVWGQRFLDAPY